MEIDALKVRSFLVVSQRYGGGDVVPVNVSFRAVVAGRELVGAPGREPLGGGVEAVGCDRRVPFSEHSPAAVVGNIISGGQAQLLAGLKNGVGREIHGYAVFGEFVVAGLAHEKAGNVKAGFVGLDVVCVLFPTAQSLVERLLIRQRFSQFVLLEEVFVQGFPFLFI